MDNGFEELGLNNVKDVDENNLRSAYEDYKAHPLKHIIKREIPAVVTYPKQILREEIIKTAKDM